MQIVSTGEGGGEWSGGEGDPCCHQGLEGGFRARYVVCTLFGLQIWRFKGGQSHQAIRFCAFGCVEMSCLIRTCLVSSFLGCV